MVIGGPEDGFDETILIDSSPFATTLKDLGDACKMAKNFIKSEVNLKKSMEMYKKIPRIASENAVKYIRNILLSIENDVVKEKHMQNLENSTSLQEALIELKEIDDF